MDARIDAVLDSRMHKIETTKDIQEFMVNLEAGIGELLDLSEGNRRVSAKKAVNYLSRKSLVNEEEVNLMNETFDLGLIAERNGDPETSLRSLRALEEQARRSNSVSEPVLNYVSLIAAQSEIVPGLAFAGLITTIVGMATGADIVIAAGLAALLVVGLACGLDDDDD